MVKFIKILFIAILLSHSSYCQQKSINQVSLFAGMGESWGIINNDIAFQSSVNLKISDKRAIPFIIPTFTFMNASNSTINKSSELFYYDPCVNSDCIYSDKITTNPPPVLINSNDGNYLYQYSMVAETNGTFSLNFGWDILQKIKRHQLFFTLGYGYTIMSQFNEHRDYISKTENVNDAVFDNYTMYYNKINFGSYMLGLKYAYYFKNNMSLGLKYFNTNRINISKYNSPSFIRGGLGLELSIPISLKKIE